MSDPLPKQEQPKKSFNYVPLFFILAIILVLTLPFHYVPEDLKMFPKENLTFNHTFVFQSDIDKVIKKYNEASFLDKIQLRSDPFTKKLFDEGLIYEEKDNTKTQTTDSNKNNTNTQYLPLDTTKTFDPTGYYFPTDTTFTIGSSYKFERIDVTVGVKGTKDNIQMILENINGGSGKEISFNNYTLLNDNIHLKAYDKDIGKIEFYGKFKFRGSASSAISSGELALTGKLYISNFSKNISFTYFEGE